MIQGWWYMHILSLLASKSTGMCTYYVQPLQVDRYKQVPSSKQIEICFHVESFWITMTSLELRGKQLNLVSSFIWYENNKYWNKIHQWRLLIDQLKIGLTTWTLSSWGWICWLLSHQVRVAAGLDPIASQVNSCCDPARNIDPLLCIETLWAWSVKNKYKNLFNDVLAFKLYKYYFRK